jgi:hypothetical protein
MRLVHRRQQVAKVFPLAILRKQFPPLQSTPHDVAPSVNLRSSHRPCHARIQSHSPSNRKSILLTVET